MVVRNIIQPVSGPFKDWCFTHHHSGDLYFTKCETIGLIGWASIELDHSIEKVPNIIQTIVFLYTFCFIDGTL